MANRPSWDELHRMLESPDVSPAEKRRLVLAAENSTTTYNDRGAKSTVHHYSNQDLDPYKKKYHITDDEIKQYYKGDGKDIADEYSDAKKQSEKNKKNNDAADRGREKLDDAKRAANNGDVMGAGVKTSDELLDAGKPGLRFFKDFLPLYHSVGSAFKGGAAVGSVGDYKMAEKRYEEQSGIRFDKFEDEVKALRHHADAAQQANTDMGHKLDMLFEHWHGTAASHAQDFFGRQTGIVRDDVVKGLDDTASLLAHGCKSVAKFVRDKASFVANHLNDHNGSLANKSVDQWKDTIDVANGSEDDDTLRRAAAAWGVHIDESCGDVSDDARENIRRKAQQVVANIFVTTVSKAWKTFTELCDKTKSNVDKAWKNVTDHADDIAKDPFTKAGDGTSHGSGDGGASHSGGGAGAPAGGGGAGAPAGGGGGAAVPSAGGGAARPSVLSPSDAAGSGSPGTQPPGIRPPGPQQHPETVTISNGDGSIEMTSPDGQGHMRVTVQDGSGTPKSYDIDFGSEGAGTGGAGTSVAGVDGAVAGPVGAPVDGQQAAAQQAADGTAGAQHVEAGADGTAVIHDGDETITVARAGDDPDQVTVTVDDGTGEPATYTVDYSDPAAAAADAPGPGTHAATDAPVETAPASAAGGPGIASAPGSGGGTGGVVSGAAIGGQAGAGAAAYAGDLGQGTDAQQLQSGALTGAVPGVASAGVDSAGAPGGPGIASAPGGHPDGGGHAGGMGMPMMGGMGAGGGQGGDRERGASSWRTAGELFDDIGKVDETTGFRAISGVLGED